VLLTCLLGAADFAVLSGAPGARVPSAALLEGVPAEAAVRALWWERHVVELLTGLAPGAATGTAVRAEYDPASVSLRAREIATAAELCEDGERVSLGTVQRMRLRYEQAGVAGLVDRRATRACRPGGRVDARVVEAVKDAMTAAAGSSTVTRLALMRQAERQLRERHGADAPAMRSQATFYRLVDSLEAGRATFGSARTRRSVAGRPGGPHAVAGALRPGELMEIDSTPLDVLVVLDDVNSRFAAGAAAQRGGWIG
jgi:hypothetical protein